MVEVGGIGSQEPLVKIEIGEKAYPPTIHPIRIPKGHKVALQWERGGGMVWEQWFSAEDVERLTEIEVMVRRLVSLASDSE